ncbi:MAG: fused MFS/spermidine synthase [Corynebacterium sp.]|nr:fused MFS/spermidine synthase [Corynebacterium sp.]
MGRKRAHETSNSPVGTYEISTGQAVVEPDPYAAGGYILNINGVPSSHIMPGEPRRLEFEYMRWIAAAIEHLSPLSNARITHLGGGGCSLARYFSATWPDSHNNVVEYDAKLAELVRELFDIPKAPRVKIRAGEARAVTDGFHEASRDIIIRDVFAQDTTPQPLTTVEFFTAAAQSLSPQGLYVANCGDHSDLRGAKAEVAGMLKVFNHVAAVADPAMFKGRRYGNIILLGSMTELPATHPQLSSALLGGGVPAQYKSDDWAQKFAAGAVANHDPQTRI